MAKKIGPVGRAMTLDTPVWNVPSQLNLVAAHGLTVGAMTPSAANDSRRKIVVGATWSILVTTYRKTATTVPFKDATDDDTTKKLKEKAKQSQV